MGSPKESKAKPQLPMENKTTRTPLLSSLKNLFQNKKKDKAKFAKEIQEKPKPPVIHNVKVDTVAHILKGIENLALKQEESKRNVAIRKDSETEEEEFRHFSYKVIEDDRKRHSSEDSGFSETKDVLKDDQEVLDSFHKLKIDNGEEENTKTDDDGDKKEERKLQLVVASRAPVRGSRVCNYNVDPYQTRQVDLQINKQALCGGQVFVAATSDNFNEVESALQQVEKLSQTSVNQSEYWDDVLQVIGEDSQTQNAEDILTDILEKEKPEDLLRDFKDFVEKEQSFCIDVVPNTVVISNPIEEFTHSHNLPNYEDTIDLNNPLLSFENGTDFAKMDYIFPTPPRSETVPSPMSESQVSFYPSNWDNSLSPERSSPIYNSDYEKYQEISHFEELSPISDKDEKDTQKKRERTNSLSSMTMKNFKDMQKDIANEFSKKDCCQMNRKTCKELFDEHISKLNATDRKGLCFKVSKMDLKTAFGVLHHVLLAASTSADSDLNLQHALFVLVCQRVLAHTPAFFYSQYGLSILKAAVLRCPHRPLFARYIVYYVYAALRQDNTAASQECIFHEVDSQGDNLIIACARGGDAYALVLAEITRIDVRGDLPPLFRIHHANADGYTALHVACSQHSASSPRLHTQHVLLEHARADLWKGDVKGGDTALHLAVNSSNCDLRVVMMLFKQIDRKMWKKLAHCQNMSSVTPLEYARSATKSTSRQNYPQEVLDFLKKCR